MDAASSGTLQSTASEQESSKSGSSKSGDEKLDSKDIDFTKDNGKFASGKLY